jgi:hypothetical protein
VQLYYTIANTPAHQRTNTPTHQYINTPTHQHINIPTPQHTSTPTYQHNNTPSHQHTNTPTQKHTNTDNGSLCKKKKKLKKRALSDIHPRQRCQPIRAGHRPPGGRRLGKTPLRLGLEAGPGESANYLRHSEEASTATIGG